MCLALKMDNRSMNGFLFLTRARRYCMYGRFKKIVMIGYGPCVWPLRMAPAHILDVLSIKVYCCMLYSRGVSHVDMSGLQVSCSWDTIVESIVWKSLVWFGSLLLSQGTPSESIQNSPPFIILHHSYFRHGTCVSNHYHLPHSQASFFQLPNIPVTTLRTRR